MSSKLNWSVRATIPPKSRSGDGTRCGITASHSRTVKITRPMVHRSSGQAQHPCVYLHAKAVFCVYYSQLMSLPTIRTHSFRIRISGVVAALSLLATPAGATESACPEQIRMAYADTELPPYLLGTGTTFQQAPGWEANLRKLFTGRVAAIAGSDSVAHAPCNELACTWPTHCRTSA